MTTLRRVAVTLLLTSVAQFTLAPLALAQPPRQDEFIPISELPPTEQMPAAPLVVAAYVFVLVVVFVYMLSVAKRVGAVQRDMHALEAELKGRKKA
jgi:hypothetical protein